MLHRRRFLDLSLAGLTVTASVSQGGLVACAVAQSMPGESLVDWIYRTNGTWDDELFNKMLGWANEYKEGDQSLGIAAESLEAREAARELLRHTKLSQIDEHATHRDQLFRYANAAMESAGELGVMDWTLDRLKRFLLESSEAEIHRIKSSLSSDVIACVVKLMTNEQLTQVGAKVFNPLPGTKIGAKGYVGARIQPNSPTDHMDDIRWQVFNAFAFAVGDVLIGTNPVSSDPDSVVAIEKTLQEITRAFELTDLLPHCVLAHIDVQSEAERRSPGSTALWFQSIAGNDPANATFDISVDKMIAHAESRDGKFGLYFETGQGADFTNGHGQGMDMVTLESRKYGFARALTKTIDDRLQKRSARNKAWVHVNDVAGFIGPEVFRSKEQLVRCCLEDIVMGKLHGLMIGLDICTTLHMDVSLDELGWCIDQIVPANPGYLMALPTRIDPMLGYLTTGYHDHVRIREKFGTKVDDRMWQFYQSIGVLDSLGKPTAHFGDPAWVYLQFCRKQNDPRSEQEIREEAKNQIAEVRSRGVFIAEGCGASTSDLPVELSNQIHKIYADAKEAIWTEMPDGFEDAQANSMGVATLSTDRLDYILHPVSGERLSSGSILKVKELRRSLEGRYDALLVVSDGLNANAILQSNQLTQLIASLRREFGAKGLRIAPEQIVVRSGRVRAGYRIGELMFGDPSNAIKRSNTILHIIGERPGSGHNTMSIYMTSADASQWGIDGKVDHNITKVISGIATTALLPDAAALQAVKALMA